jgi:hypothetical protein
MADTVVTVIAGGGGDYTTIVAAEAATDISAGKYIIRISDNSLYNEDIIIGHSGTNTSTNHVVLEAASANSHAGVPGTGHARITQTDNTNNPLNIIERYTVVQNLDIISDDPSGNYTISIGSGDNIFSRCIFRQAASAVVDQCFDVGQVSESYFFDNCLFLGHNELFDIRFFNVNSRHIQLYFDHCAYDSLDTLSELVYVDMVDTNSGDGTVLTGNDVTVHAYNCWGFEGELRRNSSADTTGEVLTLNGDQNVWERLPFTGIYSYDTIQASANDVQATGGVTDVTTTASAIIITNDTTVQADYDATPVAATGAGSNLILKNGVNRIGSEPDSRQDFSTDIAGNTRSTSGIDIGPFQFSAQAGFKYWNGSTWADSVSVKYYNGTAWADVTAVKYWNGSTWADPV